MDTLLLCLNLLAVLYLISRSFKKPKQKNKKFFRVDSEPITSSPPAGNVVPMVPRGTPTHTRTTEEILNVAPPPSDEEKEKLKKEQEEVVAANDKAKSLKRRVGNSGRPDLF